MTTGVSSAATDKFLAVTELPGEEISQEQFARLCHRYYWSGTYCKDRDVLEVACGSGPGLLYISSLARSLRAGDFSPEVLAKARNHIGNAVDLSVFDAQRLPFASGSLDVVIMFEALYYLQSAERFVAEARRALKPGGILLIVNANKDLYDFNPSPYSFTYHGVVELRSLLGTSGFSPSFFGYMRTDQVSLRQRVLRPLKAAAVHFNMMPQTMTGKLLLKRIVFGSMMQMPMSIVPGAVPYSPPAQIAPDVPDRVHKVIYCAALRS